MEEQNIKEENMNSCPKSVESPKQNVARVRDFLPGRFFMI